MSDTSHIAPTQTMERPRAVFSQQDFELIRVAISHYLQDAEDVPEARKLSNLYHRLARVM